MYRFVRMLLYWISSQLIERNTIMEIVLASICFATIGLTIAHPKDFIGIFEKLLIIVAMYFFQKNGKGASK